MLDWPASMNTFTGFFSSANAANTSDRLNKNKLRASWYLLQNFYPEHHSESSLHLPQTAPDG